MLKKARKGSALALLLTLAMVLTCLAPVGNVQAAKKVPATAIKFSNNGYESNYRVMVIGETYQLTYKLTPSNSTDTVTFSTPDTTKVTVTASGKITPKKSGAVRITAKTSSGVERTATYLVATKNGTTSLAKRVPILLGATNLSKTYLRNLDTTGTLTIPAGDYTDKNFYVKTPNGDVVNNGTFKSVTIYDVKDGTWFEKGKGNSFKIKDAEMKFNVAVNSIVKAIAVMFENAKISIEASGTLEELNVTGANTNVELKTNGEKAEVKKVVVSAKTELTISGEGKKVVVEVAKGAEGSKVTSSVPVEVSAGAQVDLKLEKGAEGSTVEKISEDIKIKVDNQSEEKVEIKTEGSDKTESVDAGKGKDETTVTPPSGGGSYVPSVPTTDQEVKGTYDEATDRTKFVLPADLKDLTAAKVVVELGSTGIAMSNTVSVDKEALTYLWNLVNDKDNSVKRWKEMTNTTNAKYGIKVEGTDDSLTKTVTYEGTEGTLSAIKGKSFTVKLLENNNAVELTYGNVTYTLTMEINRVLYISGNVTSKVHFVVSY